MEFCNARLPQKAETYDYQAQKKSLTITFCRFYTIHERDRRTDRQTHDDGLYRAIYNVVRKKIRTDRSCNRQNRSDTKNIPSDNSNVA